MICHYCDKPIGAGEPLGAECHTIRGGLTRFSFVKTQHYHQSCYNRMIEDEAVEEAPEEKGAS